MEQGVNVNWVMIAFGVVLAVAGFLVAANFERLSRVLEDFARSSSLRPDLPIPRKLIAGSLCFILLSVGTLFVLAGFGVDV
jgi:hypothetical protein